MPELDRQDKQFLEAAEGWLELGNWNEANAELEEITAAARAHPDVLTLRFRVYETAGKWDSAVDVASALCKLKPNEGLPCAYLGRALSRAGNTQVAIDFLAPAADNFPTEPAIAYELACCLCELGDVKKAYEWLKRAISVADDAELKMWALDDKRLQPIWRSLQE